MAALTLAIAGCGSPSVDEATLEDPNRWQVIHPELTMAVSIPPEARETNVGLNDFEAALSDRLGIHVEIKHLSGYGPSIEALSADQIDAGIFGAGAVGGLYDLLGEDALPIVSYRTYNGDIGYYSALIVRADSPFERLEDLQGKRIGYTDFNSTSGYIFPRAALADQGVDADSFFGDAGITGGMIQGLIALATDQYDAIFSFSSYDNEEEALATGYFRILNDRGIINAEDFRMIWFAGPIPQSSLVMRGDKNPGFEDLMAGVMTALPYEAPDVVQALGLITPGSTFQSINLDTYAGIIDMRRAEIEGTARTVSADGRAKGAE